MELDLNLTGIRSGESRNPPKGEGAILLYEQKTKKVSIIVLILIFFLVT